MTNAINSTQRLVMTLKTSGTLITLLTSGGGHGHTA